MVKIDKPRSIQDFAPEDYKNIDGATVSRVDDSNKVVTTFTEAAKAFLCAGFNVPEEPHQYKIDGLDYYIEPTTGTVLFGNGERAGSAFRMQVACLNRLDSEIKQTEIIEDGYVKRSGGHMVLLKDGKDRRYVFQIQEDGTLKAVLHGDFMSEKHVDIFSNRIEEAGGSSWGAEKISGEVT